MNHKILLSKVASYSNDRVDVDSITINNFVTTDSLLQNKQGLGIALNLPPQEGNLPKFKKNDILVGNIRPYLKKIWFADKEGGCSADVLVFRVKKEYNPKFVYYAIFRDDFFKHMMRGSKGTKMPRGDKNQIMDFVLPKFNKLHQDKIANILTNIDKKIELNNRINTELEAMAKTLYDYWFVQFDFPFDFAQGKPSLKGKPYQSSGGKMIFNKTLKREIPEGWETCYLENVVKIHDSKRIPLSKSERAKKKGTYPYFGATSIMDYIDDYIFNDIYVLLAEDGSVINKNGNPVLQYVWGKIWVNNHAHVLEGTNGFSNEYLHLTLSNIPVIQIMSGSIQKKINQKNLRKTKIIKPPIKLLKHFQKIIKPLYEKHIHISKENQQLTQLRDWLLPMLMNGQVTVK